MILNLVLYVVLPWALLLIVIPVFLISAIFFTRFKKIFYSSLIFIAFYVYFYAVINVVAKPFYFTNCSFSQYSIFFDVFKLTCYFATVYGGIAMFVSLMRRFFKLSARKLFLISLTVVIIGLIGIVISYLLPCEFSSNDCCKPPIAPMFLPMSSGASADVFNQ